MFFHVIIYLTVGLLIWKTHNVTANFPFESCNDYGAVVKGNCTLIEQDGAVGAESVNTVWIQGGYLDYGSGWGGCPYKNNTCPNGFSFYGWIKFKAYPNSCSDYGVVVSTPVFNIHILGNGHLAVYAWLSDGTEYYAETFVPVMLDVYHSVIVQFQYFSSNNSWQLVVVIQSQLSAIALFGRQRTYIPPNMNLLFGGSGNGPTSHNASIQLDRTTLDYQPQSYDYIYQVLLDVYTRQSYCNDKYGILTKPLSCYWVETTLLNWTNAYVACSSYAYTAGYPYARLASFPSWNASVWDSITNRLAYYGNGSTYGYNAWIGGGHQMQWLNASMVPLPVDAIAPPGVTSNKSTSTNSTCMQVNTKTEPWQWSETTCGTTQRYICEMSWDCLYTNPCQNLGACQPINDGENICKCWPGTSGRFCEQGFPTLTCINNCTCSNPQNSLGDCSLCENSLKVLLKLIKQFILTLKLTMINLNNDYEVMENFECSVNEQFKNFSSQLQNLAGFSILLCEDIVEVFIKFIVQKFFAQRYKEKFSSTIPLPANLTTLLQVINLNQESLKISPCFTDAIMIISNTTYYNDFKLFYNWMLQQYNADVCNASYSSLTSLNSSAGSSFSSFSCSLNSANISFSSLVDDDF